MNRKPSNSEKWFSKNWGVFPVVVGPFQMQFHFPLNHDCGRKSTGWQKKESNEYGQDYGKKMHFLHQSFEQFFLDIVSSLSQQWFHGFKHPNKKKTDNYQLTFQLRINEELIASWSCDDDVPLALIKECTTSLMHPSSEASPYLDQVSDKNACSKKKRLQEFWRGRGFFFIIFVFILFLELFVCPRKKKKT